MHRKRESNCAGVAELVDALDLGSSVLDVGVRVPSPVQEERGSKRTSFFLYGLFPALILFSFLSETYLADAEVRRPLFFVRAALMRDSSGSAAPNSYVPKLHYYPTINRVIKALLRKNVTGLC